MTSSFYRAVLALVLVGSISACISGALINLQQGNKQARYQFTAEQNRVSVPFYWYDGHIIIEVNINDKKRLRFALDSGAAATVMFESERTKGITLDISQQLPLNGKQVDVVANATVSLAGIEIADLVIIHVPIAESPLFGDLDQAYFDGAIGYDLLRQYLTEIDFEQQLVHFYPAQSQLDNKGWQAKPITLAGNIPYLSAKLTNAKGQLQSFEWTIDTGAPDYLYLNSNLSEALTFPSQSYVTEVENFEDKQQRYTSRMEALELLDSNFEQVASHNLTQFSDDISVGLIGAGLLRNFNLRFDYANQQLWFQRNNTFSTNSLVDRSGLELEPHKNGAYVKSVAQSASLAIPAGAVITSIDNKVVTVKRFDQLRALLSSQRKSIDICWQQTTKTQCQSLNLQDRF